MYFECKSLAEITSPRCRRTFAATVVAVAAKGLFCTIHDKSYFVEMASTRDFAFLTTTEITATYVVSLEKTSSVSVRDRSKGNRRFRILSFFAY